ncbi:RAD9, HUS1, RAD1-interacting nuclear orphan protein 1 [Genypterus blacodes]|uniref:RAD9, HUS1, RAD1-interacting nuclear orphan protein 1 n=1 Tax=Genypterus blacodes TaxID=154954 RepID=UPI003F77004A
MPRKAKKSDKPPLLFLEQPSRGAKVQNEPEVRAAFNPKPFFTEAQSHSNTTLNTWVSPQFDPLVEAASPVKRGRRRCLDPATSIVDRSSRHSKKTSVCKFPSLSFETKSRECFHPPRQTRRKAATEVSASRPRGSRQIKSTASHPSGRIASVGKRNVKQVEVSADAASSSRCLDPHEASSIVVTEKRKIPESAASTPPATKFRTPDVSFACTPPDVDTPNALHEGNSCTSSPFLYLLMPGSPPSTPPDILVADTPERDYGVKVTWRRRRSLMLLLKERGNLSDSEVLIHS